MPEDKDPNDLTWTQGMALLRQIAADAAEIRSLLRGSEKSKEEGPGSWSEKPKEDPNDPTVKVEPKLWKGASFKGKKLSECPTDYLIALRDFKSWCVRQDESKGNEKGAGFGRRDVAVIEAAIASRVQK